MNTSFPTQKRTKLSTTVRPVITRPRQLIFFDIINLIFLKNTDLNIVIDNL